MKDAIFYNLLVTSEEQSKIIMDLLSKFSSLKLGHCAYNYSSALENFFSKKPAIMFVDLEHAGFLSMVQSNTIFIGFCNKKQLKSLKKYLDMGFRCFIEKPIKEEEFLSVLGVVLNDYSFYLLYQALHQNAIAAERTWTFNESKEKEKEKELVKEAIITQDSIFLRGDMRSETLRIFVDDILYLQLVDKNVIIYFENGSTKTMKSSLKNFQNRMPSHMFQKVNRTTIINLHKTIRMVQNSIFLVGNIEIVTSRVFKKQLKEILKIGLR